MSPGADLPNRIAGAAEVSRTSGSLVQTWDAADEKDLEVAIDVFLNSADIVIVVV